MRSLFERQRMLLCMDNDEPIAMADQPRKRELPAALERAL
jgi:hypothetical protein